MNNYIPRKHTTYQLIPNKSLYVVWMCKCSCAADSQIYTENNSGQKQLCVEENVLM